MEQASEGELFLSPLNAEYLDRLYQDYLEKKEPPLEEWNRFFQTLDKRDVSKKRTPPGTLSYAPLHQELRVMQLIDAYRTFGHLEAKVNPIALGGVEEKKPLNLSYLGFTEEEMDLLFPTCGIMPQDSAPLRNILSWLKETYCGKIGIEYMGTENLDLEEWIQKRIEPNRFKVTLPLETKRRILDLLNHSELFEKFLHTKFVGQKRFSLEGGETLIPIIATVIESLSKAGGEEFVIGMAHRGRLNVLSNILKKARSDIFNEFEDRWVPNSFQGSGDVKYHKGFTATVKTESGKEAMITLTPNPSHLESVNAVVEGQVRAKQDSKGEGREDKVIPILVHGDAALSGQGIVYETLQMCSLDGYKTGGTIHIVINNQIGFTTLPKDGRSTVYCTDIAKAFGAPVFHVNAEDPEACVFATELAALIRQTFHIDVFIDINCYRKYGHNESDEPAYTQPLEYQLIRSKKSIRELFRDHLIHQGLLEKEVALKLEDEFHHLLQEEMDLRSEAMHKPKGGGKEEPSFEQAREEMLRTLKTEVGRETLASLAEKIGKVPAHVNIHPKLSSLLEERMHMAGIGKEARPIDWGFGETLAFATLLNEGHSIRIAGQDSCRGTFSHRHAVLVDQKVHGTAYIPLSNIHSAQGSFYIYNSFLSEYAALGFEYGYSLAAKDTLVIWEAQFGDFANGGQVVIDQYIASSEQKWGQQSGIVLLLPHGYEGQGPEHSSARLERFLQLAAENNMFIANPTTPAQMFHLLRRQAMRKNAKPLVIMTPKGLLRHPQATSTLDDLAHGSFQEVLDDPLSPEKTDQLLFVSGRFYYDLVEERKKAGASHMAIVRIEQLYPLHAEKVSRIIDKYKGFKEVFYVQEEPSNMGPADYIIPRLKSLLPGDTPLRLISRERSAATATGSHTLHKKQHQEMMHALFKEAKPTLFDIARSSGKEPLSHK